MLNQPTLEKLQTLHLHGMAEAFRCQTQQTGLAELSFEERLAMLVDQEWLWRQNRALARRLSQTKFRYRTSVEDIDFRLARGLDRSLTQNSAWVHQHQHVFCWGLVGSERPGSLVPWPRRLAGTDSPPSFAGRPNCSGIWLWPTPTAV